jgi:SPP1 gp7 family putative phage head morphogenesis protein
LERLFAVSGGSHGVFMARQFFSPAELAELAWAFAQATGTAHLLGRARIMQRREEVLRREGIDPLTGRPLTEAVLDLPDHRQTTDYSCGAAALQSALDFFGIPVPERQLMSELGTSADVGTDPDAILAVARMHGLDADGRGHLTLGDLCRALEAGLPVLCPIQAYGSDAQARRLQTGHWVVVIGYDPDAGELYIQDPVNGQVCVSAADFDRGWADQDAAGTIYDHYGIVLGRPGGPVNESRQALREVAPMPPGQAIQYFSGLIPTLGTDPQRFGADLQRHAFTLAVATDRQLLQSVQDAIRQRLQSGQSAGPQAIQALLDQAGVTPDNPQYAEMVFRTNTMDAYNQGGTQALQDPDVSDTFPVWQYSNPHDRRSRPSHAERDGNYYPAAVPFVQVRGTDIADAANCRCTSIPIDKWTWAKRRAAGARIADGYADVPADLPPAPTPAPSPPPAPSFSQQWQPAGRIQDAEQFVRQLGVGEVDLGRMRPEIANIITRSLAQFADEGKPLPAKIVAGWANGGIAAFRAAENAIIFDSAAYASADRLEADSQKFFQSGWWSSGEKDHVVQHEMGHLAHFHRDPANYLELQKIKKQPLPPQATQDIQGKVSRYAQTNALELVAELYAGMRSGKVYPPEVMQWYNHFGGPTP